MLFITQAYQSDKLDFHKALRILYLSEQKHLVKWGRSITGDIYIAGTEGPLPLNTYFIFRNQNINLSSTPINPDFLSQSDLECLTESFSENCLLSFVELVEKVCSDRAYKDTEPGEIIDLLNIARSGGADSDMIKYIELQLDNEQFFL